MWWDLDGGTGDRHRIMIDERGEIWGWENVKPRDAIAIKDALLSGVSQWYHYTINPLGHRKP